MTIAISIDVEPPQIDFDDPAQRALMSKDTSVSWDVWHVLQRPRDFILESSLHAMRYSEDDADKKFRRQQRERRAAERALEDLARSQKAVRL